MSRLAILASLVMLCVACSGGVESYEDAAEAQIEIMREMIRVLEGVSDDASARAAAGDVAALAARMQSIADQLRALPPPSREEIDAISALQEKVQREIQPAATAQMMKLAQYPVLAEAWDGPMLSMR